LRLLAVCENAPSRDPAAANGSTLITAHVLPRLPDDHEIDLVYFDDLITPLDPDVAARCRSVTALPLAGRKAALACTPVTSLPRATWQRSRPAIRGRISQARPDVTYLHGLHTFGLAASVVGPLVVHEVDPWSLYWQARATQRRGLAAQYDRIQARRADRLERRVAQLASSYLVVSPQDASALERRTGRPITAVPNGLDLAGLTRRDPAEARTDTLVFVGTLDYPPNIDALRILCRDVFPAVRARVPGTRLQIAGRRAGPEIRALCGPGVELIGGVPSVRDVFAGATAAVFAGGQGQGMKNTLREALAVGCPVIAAPGAARGLATGPHLRLGETSEALASLAIELLTNSTYRTEANRAASAFSEELDSWDIVATRYAKILQHCITQQSHALRSEIAPTRGEG
jgi:glycosyltransferase involved in cell wall biosynthesis